MNDIDKLVNAIITHNLQIGMLVAHIEQRYPGKTLADLLIEEAMG